MGAQQKIQYTVRYIIEVIVVCIHWLQVGGGPPPKCHVFYSFVYYWTVVCHVLLDVLTYSIQLFRNKLTISFNIEIEIKQFVI